MEEKSTRENSVTLKGGYLVFGEVNSDTRQSVVYEALFEREQEIARCAYLVKEAEAALSAAVNLPVVEVIERPPVKFLWYHWKLYFWEESKYMRVKYVPAKEGHSLQCYRDDIRIADITQRSDGYRVHFSDDWSPSVLKPDFSNWKMAQRWVEDLNMNYWPPKSEKQE